MRMIFSKREPQDDSSSLSDTSSEISATSQETQTSISSLSSAASTAVDPACVVGMACRVPGAATPAQLWENIVRQVDLRKKIPSDRFNVDAWYHPDGTHKGTTNAKYMYPLDQDLGLFDAGFFHISGKEAEAMDPQQRLLLEVVYEALEDAGITLDEIKGTQTSVFCGTFTNDYNAATTKDLIYYPKYTVTGTGNSILSNRISYFYDLHGPSATIDTACSSSLVCFHMGNQSLLNGEADISIVVGSALHYDPKIFVEMTDLGMLSTDGRCRHGDAQGSGYVRGEGITAVVLKRQKDAELSGNRIRALVRGTGANHDGTKQGITLPSPEAQADLIRRVYKKADIDPKDTGYVECHGTGTKAGDPRELRALSETLSAGRDVPLHVGSVKTNIGHLEGASGLAGVMKSIMALEHQKIPPNMHFNTPNPEIDFDGWKLKIPSQIIDWKTEVDRRVSINSFGYGGTNGHVILQEYKSLPDQDKDHLIPPTYALMRKHRPYLLPLTSHSERAGKFSASKFAQYLKSHPNISILDLVSTLSEKRTMHAFRSFAIGSSTEHMIESIENTPPIANWAMKLDSAPRLGFVFTGQGAQWFGMGRQLIEQSPIFRQSLEKCDRILASLPDKPDWSVLDELMKSKETTRLGETTFSQPICTALQLALVELMGHWGIRPTAVVGHSSGEMAAAYAAGALSFENAIVAAYYRGVHMGNGAVASKSKKGAMMAIGMSESGTVAELQPYAGRLAIAAMNSPVSFTISGDEDAIIELQSKLNERKIFARRLQVGQAFHSHHMNALAPAYEKALQEHPGFGATSPKALMVSSVTARTVDAEVMGPSYFTANMTGTVKFADALTGIVLDEEDKQSVDVLVEIGAHPALKGPSKQTLDSLKLKIPYLGSLDRSQPAFESLLGTAGQLFSLGYPVDLPAVNRNAFFDDLGSIVSAESPLRLRDLPTYGWDHERYWSETRLIKDNRLRKFNHEILGAQVPGSLKTRPRFRNHLRISEIPWLADHKIDGKVIFPAAGYINMAIEAASRLSDEEMLIKQFRLKDISVKSALVISEKDLGSEIIFEMQPSSESAKTVSAAWYDFAIFSVDESGQVRDHCTGLVQAESGEPSAVHRLEPFASHAELQKRSYRCIAQDKYYAVLNQIGLQYGASFQLLSGNLECGPGFATAPLSWKPSVLSQEESSISILHPALLDAALHPAFAAIESQLGSSLNEPFVPTFIKSLNVSGTLNEIKTELSQLDAYASVNTVLNGPRIAINDIRIENATDNHLLIDIQGLELTSLGGDEDSEKRSLFFGTKWKPIFTGLDQFHDKLDVHGIAYLMDIYVHQHPNSKILHYSPCARSTENILSTLGGTKGTRRRFGKFSIIPVDAKTTYQYDELVTKYGSLVEIVESTSDKFDAIIVSAPLAAPFSEQLEGSGYLFSDATEVVASNLILFSSASNLKIYRHVAERHLSSDSTPLTLLMPNEPSQQADELAEAIQLTSTRQVMRKDFASVAGENSLEGDFVILASVGRNMFFDGSGSTHADFKAAQALLTSSSCNVLWLTQGGLMDCPCPEQAIVSGLSRSARSENENLRLVLFDISDISDKIQTAQSALNLLNSPVPEDEIAERRGILYIPRVEADDHLNARLPNGVNHEPSLQPLYQRNRPLALRIPRPGLLETLSFSDDLEILNEPVGEFDLEIEVKASAVNFRDVAASMGIIDDSRLGDECAGIVIRKGKSVSDDAFVCGDRVVAWRPGQGAHRTVCRNPASLCYKLGPISFSFAAALPLILTTAHYSLVDTARLQPGETVLIHSAAGGVGQMAIQIAKMIGANIIATAGSASKRELLKSTYGLEDHQILSSRDDTFVEGVMRLTKGHGVDVALNSLAGKLLHATWACLAPFGRFIEIGKRDIHQSSKIDMDPFRKNVTFSSVDLITMYEKNKQLGARVFQECCQLVHEGKIQPPETITEVSYADAERGFRLLQMGKVTGKVVLVPGENDQVLVQPPQFSVGNLFKSEKTYLVVGGLGGLGRSMSEWLFRRGARRVAFLSRSGDKSAEAKETVRWLRAREVTVTIVKGDVTDIDAVKSCVETIGNSLAGVFHAAMVLQDAPLNKMTYRQWQKCLLPKVRGAWNLHLATVNTNLDFFVCFSSVSAILGSQGQANYSAGNNYLDALCRRRRSIGLAASSMNVGMITGIGAVSEDAALQSIMERIGYDGVNEQELFAQIETAVTCDQLNEIRDHGFEGHQTITGVNLRKPDYYWSFKPLFRSLYANHDFFENGSSSAATKSLTLQLQSAHDEAEKVEIMTSAFIEKIAAVLSVEQTSIQPTRGLADYGLDSIVAVEIRKWFSKTASVELAVFDVLGSKTIKDLISKAVSLLPQGKAAQENDSKDIQKSAIKSKTDEKAKENSQQMRSNTIKPTTLEEIPMSTFQKRLWFVHNMVEDGSFLNLPVVFHIKRVPNASVLQYALEELKRRNQILRTAYFEGDEFAQQMVTESFAVDLPVLDITSESKLNEYVTHQQSQKLNIEEGEVMKTSLVRLPDNRSALVLIFHHIAIDRGSSKSFLSQLTGIYDCIRTSSDLLMVPQPTVQYADFSAWHNERLQSPEMEDHIKYWKSKYSEQPAPSKLLPFAKTERPENNDYRRQIQRGTLTTSMLNRMKRISTRLGITPAQFLIGAFRAFLYRYTEEDDLTIHMIDGNRPHGAVADTLGFFVNVVPIRYNTNNDVSFESMLQQVSALTLEALEHSAVPFDTIVETTGCERSSSIFPLGQVIFNYQMHGTMPSYPTQDFEIYAISGEDIPSACELNLEALEDPSEGLKLRLESSSTLYDSSSMDMFLENFTTFLTSAIKDHRQPISEIRITGEKELAFLKDNFYNMTTTPSPWAAQSVMSKIASSARERPGAIAVQTSDGEELTYESLIHKAFAIASQLKTSGVKAGDKVAIYSKPGMATICSMVGALAARSGYVSLDPDFAAERLTFMVTDSGASVILTTEDLKENAISLIEKGSQIPIIAIKSATLTTSAIDVDDTKGDDPFYMIYTSGSTGKPKGVVLSQSNTAQMLSTLQKDYCFTPTDRFLHHSSICFDLSVVQIFSALTCGARVCVASQSTRKDPAALASYMERSGVTTTYFTPTQFALLLEHAKPALESCSNYRVAFFAGERLPVRLAKAFYDLKTPAILYNTWSPSELVVQTTIQRVEYPADNDTSIPIGVPMANTRHYVLDSKAQPLPRGFIGELVVGGAQVGQGYLNRPEANKSSFIKDPFCSESDKHQGWTRMFRTGDKGRFRPDGSLEFHGRIAGDKQIKLRGFRIDLGEVEQRLFVESNKDKSMPGLMDISVIARSIDAHKRDEEETDNRQIIAFVVPKRAVNEEEKRTLAVHLQETSSQYLNTYMLPSGYQFLDALPTTIGGKVDLRALLDYDLKLTFPTATSKVSEVSEATNSATHVDGHTLKEVTQLFKDVLKLPEDYSIQPDDRFFDLGGSSILMLRLQAKLKRTAKKTVALGAMFKTPTPRGITALLDGKSISMAPQGTSEAHETVDWAAEATLPPESRYMVPYGQSSLPRSKHTDILLTGVDSFIGVHMLATLLRNSPCVTVHVVGSQKVVKDEDITASFDHYRLSNSTLKPLTVQRRVVCVPGSLQSPHFGLTRSNFEELGATVHGVYHLGSMVSLLQPYGDLKKSNVTPIHDLIELATLGEHKTEISFLSTWSVPHLQTWSTTQRQTKSTKTITEEVSADHFMPESNSRYGYFKSRWVAEILLQQAAARGFQVNIIRSSAVTAHSRTHVPEPRDDFIRRMVLSMVEAGAVPLLKSIDVEFAIDFIPVDYLVESFYALVASESIKQRDSSASDATASSSQPKIYHVGNPSPMPLSQLPILRADDAGPYAKALPLDEWLEAMSKVDSTPDAQLRWSVLKDYFDLGHNMFALDRRATKEALESVGIDDCAPVDGEYLRGMMRREISREI